MYKEVLRTAPSGVLVVLVLLTLIALDVVLFIYSLVVASMFALLGAVLFFILFVFLLTGIFVVNPNEARVMQFFGRYTGTVRDSGLRWANPFYTKRRVSVRVRNFETERSKVNDANGNPVELAAVIVWKVVDTAEASFEVDNFENFMHVQSESALRSLATQYPYDTRDDNIVSLRGNTEEVTTQLRKETQSRLDKAGLEVLEARITHLAYAPEIASAMLQRQQAGAIVEAREKIVEGAVSMVEMALEALSSRSIVELDEERKAAMVSNLLVVLCADKSTQPVVNTGAANG